MPRAREALTFQGVMPGAQGARLADVGVVRDGQLTATVSSHKARWYWRIERDFHLQGALEATLGAAARSVVVSGRDRRCTL